MGAGWTETEGQKGRGGLERMSCSSEGLCGGGSMSAGCVKDCVEMSALVGQKLDVDCIGGVANSHVKMLMVPLWKWHCW